MKKYKLWWGEIVIYETLCFDVAQGRMNGAPNETRTHSCRFARQACQPLHHQKCPGGGKLRCMGYLFYLLFFSIKLRDVTHNLYIQLTLKIVHILL